MNRQLQRCIWSQRGVFPDFYLFLDSVLIREVGAGEPCLHGPAAGTSLARKKSIGSGVGRVKVGLRIRDGVPACGKSSPVDCSTSAGLSALHGGMRSCELSSCQTWLGSSGVGRVKRGLKPGGFETISPVRPGFETFGSNWSRYSVILSKGSWSGLAASPETSGSSSSAGVKFVVRHVG